MTNDTIKCRIATHNDEEEMYAVIEEVAPEIPVPLDTEVKQERQIMGRH